MCGLAGVVISHPELITMDMARTMFSLLMRENDDRGGHSWGAWGTGIAPIRKVGKFYPNAEDMHDHFANMKFAEEGPTFLFGHTRFATHGARNEINAHPFEFANLTLAHNGVVSVEGYDDKDHAVDSGRIAKALVERGWVEGMLKVSGSCGLLVTVDNVPMVYRHNQILHYCEFPWGVAISSTDADLSIVLRRNMGLDCSNIKKVPEDTFCQPGFGAISLEAKAAISTYSNPNAWRLNQYDNQAWDDGDGWWDQDDRWSRGWGGRPTERSYGLDKVSGPQTKGGAELEKASIKVVNPIKVVDEAKEEDLSHLEDVDNCEFCGYEFSTHDLHVVKTDYSMHEMILCTDCIIDEFTRGEPMDIKARYDEFLAGGARVKDDPYEWEV